MNYEELNLEGCFRLACEVVKSSIVPFTFEDFKQEDKLVKKYCKRKQFINNGKYVKMVADLMDRDLPKFRKGLIDRLNEEFFIANKKNIRKI